MLIERRSFLATMTGSSLAATTAAAAQPLAAAAPKAGHSEFDFVRDFKGVGDGRTDNAAVLKAFNEAAKRESAAGRAVVLHVPPGTYNFNHARCYGFLMGIKQLSIHGHGAVFQNTYDQAIEGPNSAVEQAWGFASNPDRLFDQGKRIDSVAVGSAKIKLKTRSDSAEFAVGEWILIGSLDIQYGGFPPNFHYFEYVKIAQVDQATGTITIEQRTRWPHRDDFPERNKGFGKAGLWHLNSKSGLPWDIRHFYYGLEIRNAPNSKSPYITAIGREITFEDCILPGLSQTVARRVVMRGGSLTASNEPDKLVDHCVYESVSIQNGLDFQSSSINSASLRDCYIDGVLLIGQVKMLTAQNCDIQWLAEGGIYGLNLAATVENCLVHRMDAPVRNFGPEAIPTKIDGDRVKFANGRFTIAKRNKDLPYWNSLPGAAVNLRASKGGFSGSLGTGYITSITGDDDNIYWDTTLPYKTLPEWADGFVRVQRAGRIRIVNSSGCASVAMASQACAIGKDPWEYMRLVFAGTTDTAGYFAGCDGVLVGATIKVIQRGPLRAPEARLVLTHYGAVTADTMSDPQNYTITIDVSELGVRRFSVHELGRKRDKDSVKLAGKELAALADNRHCWNVFNWSYTGFAPSAFPAGELPIVEVVLEFDSGIFRNGIPTATDFSGKAIAGISGGFF